MMSSTGSSGDQDSGASNADIYASYDTEESETRIGTSRCTYEIDTDVPIELGGTVWKVENELGKGGNGIVYKCSQIDNSSSSLPKTIAVKVSGRSTISHCITLYCRWIGLHKIL